MDAGQRLGPALFLPGGPLRPDLVQVDQGVEGGDVALVEILQLLPQAVCQPLGQVVDVAAFAAPPEGAGGVGRAGQPIVGVHGGEV